MERMFAGTFFVPVPSTGIPAKAGQFLSCKHSIPLCQDDIMLTLQSVEPGMKNVPSRQTSCPGKRPVPANVPSGFM